MNKLATTASVEMNGVGGEIASGAIVKDYEKHIGDLRRIASAGKVISNSFLVARSEGEWKYYATQTGYVFRDNPDNLGPNSIINATEGLASHLEQWSSVKDRENKVH
jgi:hypothetical protein